MSSFGFIRAAWFCFLFAALVLYTRCTGGRHYGRFVFSLSLCCFCLFWRTFLAFSLAFCSVSSWFLLASWVLVVVFSVELSGTAVTSFVQFPVFVCFL